MMTAFVGVGVGGTGKRKGTGEVYLGTYQTGRSMGLGRGNERGNECISMLFSRSHSCQPFHTRRYADEESVAQTLGSNGAQLTSKMSSLL